MKIDPFPGVLTAQFVDRPFTTKLGKAGCQRVKAWVLTDEQRAWLCKWFPEEENSRLMKASGMSHSTLHRFASEFGLTKSPKGWKRIKKRQAAHIKRVCEKNGYYDSLRGRQPSEACRKATAQMWQDIRDGKREHQCRRHRGDEVRTVKDTKQHDNIFDYTIGGEQTGHPAVFPKLLARDQITSWSNEGDIVFDPFMGSGTTAYVARALGRHYLGFEISPEYCKLIDNRLERTKTLFDL